MRLKFGAAIVVAGLAMGSNQAHAECGEVTMTEMNWASSAVVTAVSKFIIEQGYGCSVTLVPSSTIPAVTSIAETGKPDIASEIWLNSAALYSELENEGKVITAANVLSDGGVESWWIPAYLAEKHPELTTIEGVLANPELVGGKFHNCPVGWGCRIHNDNLTEAFGFEAAGMEVFDHGSGETLAASIAAAYADEAPWFGYYWAPTSVLGKYPMVAVDMGEFDAEAFACNANDDCANPGKTPYAPAPVLTGVTTDFAARQPDIMALMENVSFSNDVMGKLLAWQEDNNTSADETAVYFLSNYADTWGSWISEDAKGKLGALLQ